jgi:hypothetical protein
LKKEPLYSLPLEAALPFRKVQSSRFKVQGSKFKVKGSKFKVQGSKFKV